MMRPILYLALAACSSADAANKVNPNAIAMDPHEHAISDVRGTLTSIEHIRDQVMAMDAKRRSEVQRASAVLMVNCPYNRASFQLPIALNRLASRYEADAQHDLIRDDWRRLRQSLSAHVEALDVLGGGDLATPAKGDYLVKLAPEHVVDRAHLDRTLEPVGATMGLMLEISELVDAYDEETKAKIDAASATLASATGDQWTLQLQLIGYKAALERMQPFIEDEAMKADVRQMITGVAYYLGQFC